MPGPYRCIRLIICAWKNRLYRLPPKKDYHVYIRVVSITMHTHDRRKSIGKKEAKKRKKDIGKEKKEKKAKKKRNRKGKKRKDKKRKQGKEKGKKMLY